MNCAISGPAAGGGGNGATAPPNFGTLKIFPLKTGYFNAPVA